MRTKKTTKPAPILAAASSNGNSKPENAKNLPTTNGKAVAPADEEDASDSVIIADNDSLITENGTAEKGDGCESEQNDSATSSQKAADDGKAESAEAKAESGTKEPTKIIRLVSIEKLMRPSLLPAAREDISKKKSSQKQTTPSSKRAKDASVIEISDTDSNDDDKPLSKKLKAADDFVQNLSSDDSDDVIVPKKKKVSGKATKASKKLIDDDDDEDEPVGKSKAAKGKQKAHTKLPQGCKNFSLRVEKLPSDLKSLMKEHNLSGILNRRNREITTFVANTNHYGDLRRQRHESGAGSSKSKARAGKKSKSSKSLVIPSSDSEEVDSDEPIASIVSKSDNIPKNNTMSKRSARSKRQLSESDDNGDSDESFELKIGKSKTTATTRSQRASRRPRMKKDSSSEDEPEEREENDGDNGGNESDDFEEEKPQPKKKRSRIKKVASSSSEDDDGNKKVPFAHRNQGKPTGTSKSSKPLVPSDVPRKNRRGEGCAEKANLPTRSTIMTRRRTRALYE